MVPIDGRRMGLTAVAASLCLFLSAGGTHAAAAARYSSATDLAPRSQAWPDPASISISPTIDSEAPALVVTDGGIAHVVWEEGDELYHAHKESSSWSAPSRVATGEQPSLAAGPDDTVHLAFVNEIGDVYNVYYTWWDGASWAQPPRKVSDTSSFSDAPDLTVASDGHLHVMWSEDGQVYYGDSADGVLWAYGAIAEGSAPTVTVDGDGNVQAAWQDEEPADYEVYFSRLEYTGWSPSQDVSGSPTTDSTAPDLVVQTDGTPHLLWQEMISATAQVRYSRGPGWNEPMTLSDSSSGAYLPSLSVDAWGRRHAAWEDFHFPTYRIRYRYAHGADSAWRSPTTVVQSPSPAQQLEEVCLYSGPDGVVHAVWVATEGGKGEILYASKPYDRIFLPVALRQVAG